MYKKIALYSCLIFILDQITKILVDTYINFDTSIKVIPNFFYLTRTSNTGAAFSILENKTIILVLVGFLTIYYLIKYIKEFNDKWYIVLTFSLIIGGILGNLSDRLFLGYVRDFLKFNIFGYNYPIFNVADIGIVVGILLLIIWISRGEDNGSKSRK